MHLKKLLIHAVTGHFKFTEANNLDTINNRPSSPNQPQPECYLKMTNPTNLRVGNTHPSPPNGNPIYNLVGGGGDTVC